MIGGDAGAVRLLEPVFRSLAPGRGAAATTPGRAGRSGTAEEGWLHCGPAGAGHFVKMVHNGIEYGLMQAFAEGFDILRGAAGEDVPEELRYRLDLAEVAEVWRRGSVVSSWLLDLAAAALAEDPGLASFAGRVPDSGEGRWTVQAAVEEGVPATVISAALYARFRSREDHTFGEKLLSAMRRQFGGHAEAAPAAGSAKP
jgi:6-phosphogluconate dehydrogenase